MSNFLRAKRVEIFIIVAIVAAIGVVYAFTRKPVTAPTTTENNQQISSVTYDGQDGRNALDLLKVFHQVDTKDTSYGPMIIGIDGVKPDSSHYWGFYVDGKLADRGADQYITKNGEHIEWKLDKIE
ncbi:MAG: DUF4430 domain-containing protein [Candidatus Doudnabacteria bacterium]|nr:DUF4430 domain-containing protein [Candidatus Doudnabacteria bacterium]